MNLASSNIRSFIGAKDFDVSSAFYRAIDFEEVVLYKDMTLFKIDENNGFYLQRAYVKDWIDNSMLFLEVESINDYWEHLNTKQLPLQFNGVRLSRIREFEYGRQFFLHDPSGILWHICQFE